MFFWYCRHCQFTRIVKKKMDENGGFEECATACKEYFTVIQLCPSKSTHFILDQFFYFFLGDSRATDAVRAACRDVGSVSDIIFEMRFNPNVFSPGI